MSYPVGNTGVSYAQKTITTTPVVKTATGTIYTLAAGEILILQNQATTPLYVRYGDAGASGSLYHYVLPACVVAADGTSPALVIDSWIGIVSVYAAVPSYVANVIS